jgi:hypothetical protein
LKRIKVERKLSVQIEFGLREIEAGKTLSLSLFFCSFVGSRSSLKLLPSETGSERLIRVHEQRQDDDDDDDEMTIDRGKADEEE